MEVDLDVIQQEPISLVDVKEKLEAIKKSKKELGFRAEKVQTYLNEVVETKKKENDHIIKELENLNITRLKAKHIIKIADLRPESVDSLKSLFAGEPVTLKNEEMEKIVKIVND